METVQDDLIIWRHGNGYCKLIQLDRTEVEGEESDEGPVWELLWIEDSGIRRFEKRLDPAFGRLQKRDRAEVEPYLAGAPEEAVDVVDGLFELVG